MQNLINEIRQWSNYMAITREDQQDTAVIDLIKPDFDNRFDTALNEMYCLGSEDSVVVLGHSFSSISMQGSVTLTVTQDGETYDEVMSVTAAYVY